MAKPRNKLNEILHTFCDNVYFQPPTGTKITYPCIIYDLDRPDATFADNAPYAIYDQYSIKYITRGIRKTIQRQIFLLFSALILSFRRIVPHAAKIQTSDTKNAV